MRFSQETNQPAPRREAHVRRHDDSPFVEIQIGFSSNVSREYLPVLIDMTHGLAFIKLHAPFFVFHRLQQALCLFLAHLALFDFLRLCFRFR